MNLVPFILAIAPVVAIVWYIYHKDRYEHEPLRYLILSFVLGLICASIVPFMNDRLSPLFSFTQGTAWELLITAFFLIAFLEELIKFICLRFFMYYRRVFNEPMDGIVYGVMIGMGFATLENLYFVIEGGWQVAIVRMFTAVPAHAVFGVVMGYYVGKAKYNKEASFTYSLKAFFVPVFLHGLYNYLLLQDKLPGLGLAAILGLIVAIRYSRKLIKEQQDASPFKSDQS